MSTSTAIRSTEIARSFFEAYNRHDVDKMVQVCSESAELRYIPMEKQGQGRAREVGKKIWSGLIDPFPDLHVTPSFIFGDERNAAAEVTIGGTQRKDFLDIPNQGKHYELPHAFILAIDDGLISSIRCYWDNLSFYSQLGKGTLGKAA